MRFPAFFRAKQEKYRSFSGSFLILAFVYLSFAIFPCVSIAQTSPTAEKTKKKVKKSDKHLRRGNRTEAEKVLREALAASPGDTYARLKLAFLQIRQHQLKDAFETSFDITKAQPENSYAYAVLGTTLLSAGRFKEARPIFYAALKLNKRESLAWSGLGMLELYENNVGRAMECLNEAVFLDPLDPDYHFAFAQVASRAERFAAAADAYARFLAVSPATDDDRRKRILSLIGFLRFLQLKPALYGVGGDMRTDVQFELRGDRPIIEVKVNDGREPLKFVLDTGSGISVISEETAKRLRIKEVSRGGHARGIGGNGQFEIVYGFLNQVQVGGIKIRNVPVYIRKFHSTGEPVDGYIGLSLISKFLTTIDYGHRRFSLARRESAAPIVEDTLSLPLRLTSSGFLSGEVQVQGIDAPLNFIVDTGASVSVISHSVARLESMLPFALDEKIRVTGSAGITDNVASYRLPKVSFGEHSRNSVTAIALDLDMINEASGFEQAGILGGNFLKNYRLTFDFQNSRVIFVPVEPDK